MAPLALETYGYNPIWCWISPNIQRCAENGLNHEECHEQTHDRRNYFYFFPLWTMVGLTTLSQALVVWTVFRTRTKANKWKFRSSLKSSADRKPSSVISSLEHPRKRAQQTAKKRTDTTQAIALQSMLYLSSFYIAWMPWTIAANILHIRPNLLDDNLYWMLLLVTILQPLQGFLNCLVYFKRNISEWISLQFSHCCIKRSSKWQDEEEAPAKSQDEEEALHQSTVLASERRAHGSSNDSHVSEYATGTYDTLSPEEIYQS